MVNNPKIRIALVTLLALANIVPAGGAWLGLWPMNYIWYFYWAECALLGGLAVLLYAKYLIVFFVILGAAVLIYNMTGHSE